MIGRMVGARSITCMSLCIWFSNGVVYILESVQKGGDQSMPVHVQHNLWFGHWSNPPTIIYRKIAMGSMHYSSHATCICNLANICSL